MRGLLLTLAVSLISLITNADPGRRSGGTRVGGGTIFRANIPLTPQLIKEIFEEEVKPLIHHSLNYLEIQTTSGIDLLQSSHYRDALRSLGFSEREIAVKLREKAQEVKKDAAIVRILFSPNKDIRNELHLINFDVQLSERCYRKEIEKDMTVDENSPNRICVNGPALADRLNMTQAPSELLALAVHELIHRNNEWDESIAEHAQKIAYAYKGSDIKQQFHQILKPLQEITVLFMPGILRSVDLGDSESTALHCYAFGKLTGAVDSLAKALTEALGSGVFPFDRKTYDLTYALDAIMYLHNGYCHSHAPEIDISTSVPQLISRHNSGTIIVQNPDLQKDMVFPASLKDPQNFGKNMELVNTYVRKLHDALYYTMYGRRSPW